MNQKLARPICSLWENCIKIKYILKKEKLGIKNLLSLKKGI